MTRKSRRELRREITDLGEREDAPAPVIAFELEDGTHVDADGEPIDRLGEVVFSLPADVWSRWTDPPAPLKNP